jgi:folate-dependent phosphoribosylglycinamide formyltransferase PurN
MSDRIVLLAGDGDSSRIVYHALATRFDGLVAVIEKPVDRIALARRRAARLGWVTVSGQVAFVGLAMPLLRSRARDRVRSIISEAGLDDGEITDALGVNSVNEPETLDRLKELDPAVVVVNGTRIISNSVLSAIGCPFLNMHAGITPRYRGVHGGYWALREGRPDLVGTTVHLVDPGIDTGGVLAQAFFEPGPTDSFATYPYLHLVHGLPLLAAQVQQVLDGRVPAVIPGADVGGMSELRWHPTLGGYLWGRVAKGVR